jgi:hypothetical protein
MITQSAMVRFLKSSLENPILAAHANRTLHDLGLSADKPVISVPLSARAIDAFQIIHRKVSRYHNTHLLSYCLQITSNLRLIRYEC